MAGPLVVPGALIVGNFAGCLCPAHFLLRLSQPLTSTCKSAVTFVTAVAEGRGLPCVCTVAHLLQCSVESSNQTVLQRALQQGPWGCKQVYRQNETPVFQHTTPPDAPVNKGPADLPVIVFSSFTFCPGLGLVCTC